VQSSAIFGGSDPVDVRVKGNVSTGNQPADLVWDGSGTNITFQNNSCETSDPADLCGKGGNGQTPMPGWAGQATWMRGHVSHWQG
jgi:hypothetical protein